MAKYRITSIPQSLPKAQLGLFKKRKKKEDQNSIINYKPLSEETIVQGIEPQSGYGFTYNTPALPTVGTFPTYDIGPQDYGRPRTPEEEANTFAEPFNWTHGETIPAHDDTYMVQSDPFGNSLLRMFHNESLAGQMGIPYSGNKMIPRTVNIPERFVPDYFKPVTETGEPLKCTDGKIAYKGQCITKEALEIILERELEINKHQWDEEFVNKQIAHNKYLDALYVKNMEIAQREKAQSLKERYNEYIENFKKSKKSTKIDAFDIYDTNQLNEMVPVIGDDGKVVMDKETGKPKMQTRRTALGTQYLLIDNHGSTGTTSAWPLNIVADRIYNNGFQPEQFKNIWKFNKDHVKQLKEQVGSLMTNAKNIYDNEAYNRILKKAVELNITPEEAAKMVAGKNSSFGYAEGLTKNYAPKVQKAINDAFNEVMIKTGSDADAEKLSPTQKQLMITLENVYDDQFLSINGGRYVTGADGSKIWMPPGGGANIIPLPAESTAVRNKVGTWTTNPITKKKQWIAPNNNTAYENYQSEQLIKEQQNQAAQIQYAALRKLIESPDITDEERLKIYNDPKKIEKLITDYANWYYSPEGEKDFMPEQTQGEYRYTPGHLKSDFKITANGAQWYPGTYGNGRYIDGPVDMVYPEKYVTGPGRGILGMGMRLLNKPLLGIIGSTAAPWLTGGNLLSAYGIYNAVRPNGTISEAYDKFSEGKYREGAVLSGLGLLELAPAVSMISKGAKLLKSTPRFFEYTAPSGRTFGLGNANLPNIINASNEQEYINLLNASTAPQLKNVFSTEADIINAEKALQRGEMIPKYTFTNSPKTQLQLEQAFQNSPNMRDFFLKNTGFNLTEGQPFQFGTLTKPPIYQTKIGQFSFGPRRFTPAKFEGLQEPFGYSQTSNNNLLGFKNGGYLPQAQGGLIALAKNLSKGLAIPVSSTVSALRKIPATYTAIAEGGNLFQNAFMKPVNASLMNIAYNNLAQGLYNNQYMKPITDMVGSISSNDANYLLTDYLADSNDYYGKLNQAVEEAFPVDPTLPERPVYELDYSNIGPFNDNTLRFAHRRGNAQTLLDLGYFGDEVTPLDLYKMARTDESMNTVTKNAIDFDRTGYRQVTGSIRPTGNILDGYGPRGFVRYDMRRQAYGAPRSEFENMDLRGVNKADPKSVAEYQATSIPMEQYGYRAGVHDMPEQDALYLASLPQKPSYGPYQFKVKQNLDWTGDWRDWMQKYVHNKPTLYLNANRENDLSKIYFNIGSAKGVPGRATDPLTNTARGTGLHTRQWISGKGNQIGIIDPTFRFTDLHKMSAEDYLEMEREKEDLIKLFNTGWRGHYKKGGVSMKLSKKEIDQYIKDGYIIEDE